MSSWFPIADEYDVVERHVARTALHGLELVAWRADDGHLNVWENRCLHRGVRLSVGVNDGAELICRYHAWRYANRSGGCTYIPAHPADAPPRTVHCATFPVVERYGLVWTTLASDDGTAPPEIDGLTGRNSMLLRARPVRAAASAVLPALADLRWSPPGSSESTAAEVEARPVDGSAIVITATDGAESETVVFFVQPVDVDRCVVRPVAVGAPADDLGALRRHASILGRFVEQIEGSTPAAGPGTEPRPAETPVSLPSSAGADRLTVRVDRAWDTADDVKAFELVEAAGAVLPAFQPGDHIDVHLPGGLVRQYSLTNGPGETACYRIGVKRAPDSTGGSRALHEETAVGDVLEISTPRNGFPLRRNVPHTLLIAGGIGITPILSMAKALARSELDFVLHHFVRAEREIAFRDVVESLGPRVRHHVGLHPDETAAVLAAELASPDPDTQVAACGPPAMLDRIRLIATERGWSDDAITMEYFENDRMVDRSAGFVVELARSAVRIEVPPGSSMLEALHAHGVRVDSSCEQGACGTCAVAVIDGEPLHQDVYLDAAERAAGDTVLTCVSRASSARLVLDL